MNKEQYRAYLRSPHWRRLRARIVQRAAEHCEWCGRFCGRAPHPPDDWCGREDCTWCQFYFDSEGNSTERERQTLEVHHRTYERVGRELETDLVALCWSCHDEVTDRHRTLQELRRAGVVSYQDSTPTAAATRFWSLLRRALGLKDRS